MKTNNNYISVIAKFIGEDGSRGFSKGTMYLLKMKITDGYIIVSSENNKSLWCPYGSLNTFLENWKLNSGEDEMSEFEKEYNDLGFRAQVLDVVLTDKDIVENFKDWHSIDEYETLKAELEYVYSVLGFLVKAHSELWTVTDGRGQFENALDDAENILKNRK